MLPQSEADELSLSFSRGSVKFRLLPSTQTHILHKYGRSCLITQSWEKQESHKLKIQNLTFTLLSDERTQTGLQNMHYVTRLGTCCRLSPEQKPGISSKQSPGAGAQSSSSEAAERTAQEHTPACLQLWQGQSQCQAFIMWRACSVPRK